MENVLLVVTLVVLVVSVVLYFWREASKKTNGGELAKELGTALDNLRQEMQRLNSEQRQEVHAKLDRTNDQLYRGISDAQKSAAAQFEQMMKNMHETSKTMQDVTGRLATLDATNKQVLDFSSQLQNLQNILRNPKQRGVLGEYWLETLLSNVLPKDAYKTQYHLGNNEATGKELIADAVILIRDQIIPIDAKFSLENYNRLMEEQDPARKLQLEKDLKSDIQTRIDETSKYIQQQNGTMNFAFMFIPAEGVYYNLMNAEIGSGINSRNLLEYAFSKHVMIVSPTSFFAYLQTVLLGLRELQLEKSTQDILKRVADLGKHFRAFAEFHSKVGSNLSTVINQYNLSSNELKKMSKDVVKITDGSSEDILDIDAVEKPMID
jgi:DNA recombination protein RmuC